MNLVQIQENLKDLPTQAIMGYANGSNPEVPPYMALSELNRRKSMEQRAAQPPTQSVKDQLEAEVGQQPPQGMPQGAPMPQSPQGIAQLPGAQPQQPPGMPPQMPQQPQGAPQGMAGGGLAGLPIPDDMFNYAPGGIVAFAQGKLVMGPGGELIEEEDAGEDEAAALMSNRMQGPPTPAPGSIDSMAREILTRQMRGETNIPQAMTQAQAKEEAIRQRPELAPILNSLPGGALTKLIGELDQQNTAGKEKFKQNEGRLGLAGLSNALIAAGEATRGHKGMALGEALGGFGKNYGKYTEESVKRDEAQQALQRQYQIESAKLQGDVESLQRAYANNDVAGIMSGSKAVAEREANIERLKAEAAKGGIDIGFKQQTLDASKARDASTAAYQAAQLEAQTKNYAAQAAARGEEAGYRKRQLEILEESRPPAESKQVAAAELALRNDRDYQDSVKKLEQYTTIKSMESPDYKYHRAALKKMRAAAYARQGLEPPEDFEMPNPADFATPKKPRWGESTPAPKSPKVIKLD